MSFSDLLNDGRRKPQAEIETDLLGLMADARFPSVLGWLDRNRDAFMSEVSKQALTGNPTAQSHAAGSVHAIQMLLAQLANLLKPAPPSSAMTKPEDE